MLQKICRHGGHSFKVIWYSTLLLRDFLGIFSQGKSEVSIKLVKRLLKVAIGDVKLTPSELQTALFEVANLCNERPIGVNKSPLADGTYKVLTPNCLLIGRSVNSVPDDSDMTANMKKADRYLLIQQVTCDFWDRWSSEVTPMYVV